MGTETKQAMDEMLTAFRTFRDNNDKKRAELEERVSDLEAENQKLAFGTGATMGTRKRAGKPTGPVFYDERSGETMQSYAKGDAWPTQGDPDLLGAVVRGKITGQWRGVPESIQNAITTTSGPDGGWLMPETVSSEVIAAVRNRLAVSNAGAVTLPMQAGMHRLVAVDQAPTVQFRAEGSTIAESETSFRIVNLTARSIAGIVRVNNEALEDAANLGALLTSELSASIAETMDSVFLFGQSTDALTAPTGLKGTLSAHASDQINTDGGALDYDDISTAYYQLLGDNVPPDNIALIMAPRHFGTLDRLRENSDGSGQYLIPPASYQSLLKIPSGQIPITDASPDTADVVLGDFRDSVIGIRTNIVISIQPGDDAFRRNQAMVRAVMRVDFAPTRLESFRILEDREIA